MGKKLEKILNSELFNSILIDTLNLTYISLFLYHACFAVDYSLNIRDKVRRLFVEEQVAYTIEEEENSTVRFDTMENIVRLDDDTTTTIPYTSIVSPEGDLILLNQEFYSKIYLYDLEAETIEMITKTKPFIEGIDWFSDNQTIQIKDDEVWTNVDVITHETREVEPPSSLLKYIYNTSIMSSLLLPISFSLYYTSRRRKKFLLEDPSFSEKVRKKYDDLVLKSHLGLIGSVSAFLMLSNYIMEDYPFFTNKLKEMSSTIIYLSWFLAGNVMATRDQIKPPYLRNINKLNKWNLSSEKTYEDFQRTVNIFSPEMTKYFNFGLTSLMLQYNEGNINQSLKELKNMSLSPMIFDYRSSLPFLMAISLYTVKRKFTKKQIKSDLKLLNENIISLRYYQTFRMFDEVLSGIDDKEYPESKTYSKEEEINLRAFLSILYKQVIEVYEINSPSVGFFQKYRTRKYLKRVTSSDSDDISELLEIRFQEIFGQTIDMILDNNAFELYRFSESKNPVYRLGPSGYLLELLILKESENVSSLENEINCTLRVSSIVEDYSKQPDKLRFETPILLGIHEREQKNYLVSWQEEAPTFYDLIVNDSDDVRLIYDHISDFMAYLQSNYKKPSGYQDLESKLSACLSNPDLFSNQQTRGYLSAGFEPVLDILSQESTPYVFNKDAHPENFLVKYNGDSIEKIIVLDSEEKEAVPIYFDLVNLVEYVGEWDKAERRQFVERHRQKLLENSKGLEIPDEEIFYLGYLNSLIFRSVVFASAWSSPERVSLHGNRRYILEKGIKAIDEIKAEYEGFYTSYVNDESPIDSNLQYDILRRGLQMLMNEL